jgi:hypothetical protein
MEQPQKPAVALVKNVAGYDLCDCSAVVGEAWRLITEYHSAGTARYDLPMRASLLTGELRILNASRAALLLSTLTPEPL